MKLTSRSIKPGDRLIRKVPLKTEGATDNWVFTDEVITVLKKFKTHIVVERAVVAGRTMEQILPLSKWDDGNWVKIKF